MGKLTIFTITLALLCVIYPMTYASVLGEGWVLSSSTEVFWSRGDAGIVHNGYIYAFEYPSGYEWAPIQANGTLGNFTQVYFINSINNADNYGMSVATSTSLIYGSGGGDGYDGDPSYQGIWIAGFNADGSLTPVSSAGTMLTPRCYHSSLVINGRFYAFGGYVANAPLGPQATVEYAPINTDGTLSTFQYTNSFSTISGAVYLAWYNGSSVYCIGSGNVQQTTMFIERSIVQPDGSLSAWTTITGPYPFTGLTVLTGRTTLFVVQQNAAGASIITTAFGHANKIVQFNPLLNLIFQSAPNTLHPRANPTIATWSRFVYLMGGFNTQTNSVDFSVEVYDPDLAGTELFPDSDTFLKSSSPMDVKEIRLDTE